MTDKKAAIIGKFRMKRVLDAMNILPHVTVSMWV